MTDLPYWQTTRLTSLTNQKTYFTDKPQDWPHCQTTRLTSLTNHKTYLTDKPQELPYWQTTRLTSLTNHKTDLTDKPQGWPHWQTTRLTSLTNHKTYLTDKPRTERNLLIVKNEEDGNGVARDEHTEKDGTTAHQPNVVTQKSKLETRPKKPTTLYQGKCSYLLNNNKHNYQYECALSLG